MESNQEPKEESQKNGCCSQRYCCGGKALGAIILLLLSGIIGYLWGRNCAMYKMGCYSHMMHSGCPMVSQTQQTSQPSK